MTVPLILLGKLVNFVSRILNLGSGGTWPGELALIFKPDILKSLVRLLSKGSILVVGTNGKTTTSLMIKKILQREGFKVIHNESGANLLNGIVSTFLISSTVSGKLNADWGVFEVDENSLPIVISNISFDNAQDKQLIIVFLNLFRDQLDRYGEVDVIAEKWSKTLTKLPKETKIILNADDPQVAYLGKNLKAEVTYFGVDSPKLFLKEKEHATDSIFCLNCSARLSFEGVYYSHIGIWKCEKCGYKRPAPQISQWDDVLAGLYNKYNTLAAVSVAKTLGFKDEQIKKALLDFSPAFGRQEEFEVNGKKIKIFLSKNPAGFNESLRTVIEFDAREILFVLNDRIPDGTDVSWIWDVDFEMIPDYLQVLVSGDRVFDLAVRIKYSYKAQSSNIKAQNQNSRLPTPGTGGQAKFKIFENLKQAVDEGLRNIDHEETLFILPTYSAMLEVRKILKGRKIL